MKTKGILMLLSFTFSFLSCRKVIDLELKESDTRYVIEGVITNEPGVCTVYLTQTKPFYENNEFAGVTGAIVKVYDNGREHALNEVQPGTYSTQTITGVPGHEYRLSVTVNGQTFTASCIMPQRVSIDTLYVSLGPLGQFKFATVRFGDPRDRRNYYRFVQYLNGVKDPTIFWESDEFTDGLTSVLQLDTGVDEKDDPRNIKTGDRVTVEMYGLDSTVYKYWYSLRSGGGDGSTSTAAPANPVTNIKGGALGYFSAQTVDRKTVIAP